MSNLGWYQVMTTLAKKVGGPRKLFGRKPSNMSTKH